MTDDVMDSLYSALLGRKASEAEKTSLHAVRDALPRSMRESPSVMVMLTLQHEHEQRMTKLASIVQEHARKAASAALRTTAEDCKREFVASITIIAETVLRKTANKAKRDTLAAAGNCWEEHALRLAFLSFGVILALVVERIFFR